MDTEPRGEASEQDAMVDGVESRRKVEETKT